MNINRIVKEKEEENNSVVVAATLSKAAEVTDKIEERCDEINQMMKQFKNDVK